MKYFVCFLIAFCLFFSISAQKDRNSELETKLKSLAEKATTVAQAKLAANPKDSKGLLLVKFAKFFNPEYRPLLLIRGQLKYKTKIEKPKNEVTELEFLSALLKAVDSVNSRNSEKNRKMLSILYSIIRIVQPGNEDALVALTELEDAGVEVNIDKLLTKNTLDFENFQNVEYDKKDQRYIISDVKKTIFVPADVPWTDSWVKVKAGKVIRARATRLWSMGEGPFPLVSADGYSKMALDKILKQSRSQTRASRYFFSRKRIARKAQKKLKGQKSASLGCLLAKIGKKTYVVGEEATFKTETSGILYFGPFEWDDYSDNSGKLMVTFEVADQ
jgi:hypothetical protein